MDPQAMEQMVQKVAELIQNGEDPNAIVEMLIQEGASEDVAMQIVDEATAMAQGGGQGGGQPAGPSGGPEAGPEGMDPQQMVEEVLQQIGPNVMLTFLQSYDALGPQGQEALKQQLQQMSDQGEAQQGTAEGAQPQGAEQAMFG